MLMFTVKVNRKQEQWQFECPEDENILKAARRQMIPISAGCRSGGCGMCKVKVSAGTFTKGRFSVEQLSPEEEKQGYTLACKTYPQSHMTIHL